MVIADLPGWYLSVRSLQSRRRRAFPLGPREREKESLAVVAGNLFRGVLSILKRAEEEEEEAERRRRREGGTALFAVAGKSFGDSQGTDEGKCTNVRDMGVCDILLFGGLFPGAKSLQLQAAASPGPAKAKEAWRDMNMPGNNDTGAPETKHSAIH